MLPILVLTLFCGDPATDAWAESLANVKATIQARQAATWEPVNPAYVANTERPRDVPPLGEKKMPFPAGVVPYPVGDSAPATGAHLPVYPMGEQPRYYQPVYTQTRYYQPVRRGIFRGRGG